MTDELFPTEETLSPRLRWMRKHGIETHTAFDPDREVAMKWDGTTLVDSGYGDTEKEALVNLAKRLGIKLWNE